MSRGEPSTMVLNGGTPAATSYNAANLTNDGTAAYTYDALSRTTARGATTYAYNGDGTLVKQIASGTTTLYSQDLAAPLSQVLQTKVGAAAITSYRSRFFGALRPRAPDWGNPRRFPWCPSGT